MHLVDRYKGGVASDRRCAVDERTDQMTMTTDGGIPIVPATNELLASFAAVACEAISTSRLLDYEISDELDLAGAESVGLVCVDVASRPDVLAALRTPSLAIPVGTAEWRFAAIEPDYQRGRRWW